MAVYASAVLSGVLYVLAYPGIGWWPLAFVALVPLLHALDSRALGGRRALLSGLGFGLAVQLLGFRFLYETLRAFSAMPAWLCALAYLLLCALHAGQQALFVWLVARARTRGVDPLLLAPFLFVALEWLYPMLFPNFFGAALQAVPLLSQSADLGGPLLLSWSLVAVNAAVAALLRAKSDRTRLRPIAVGAATMIATAVYGALRIPNVEAAIERAPKLELGIVQADMGTHQKRQDRAEGRRRHLEQSRELERGAHRPELLVWPETAVQYVLPADSKSVAQVLEPLTTPVLFGGVAHRVVDGRARLWNSAFITDAAAHVLGRADKMRLIPFAERIPLSDRFPKLYDLLPNSGDFTPGDSPRALPFRKQRIATLICYEDVLPGFVREVVRATRPHLLVNLTNDAWFGHTVEPEVHLALSVLRAIEHRRFFVRASNSGVSAVISATGVVLARTRVFERATLQHEVALLDAGTPYEALGDFPGWLGALSVLFVLRRRRAPQPA